MSGLALRDGSGCSLIVPRPVVLDNDCMELTSNSRSSADNYASAKRALGTGALVVGAFALSACGADLDFSFGEDGTGSVETRVIEVDNFTMIDLDSALDAVIKVDPAAESSLSFTTHPNLFDNLDVDVSNGRLKLSINDVGDADEVQATIVVGSLAEFEASGAISAEINGVHDDISIKVDGASDVDASTADNTTISNLTVDADGASSMDLSQLSAKTATVDIDGASSVDVNVTEKVSGSVSGASDLDVEGGGRVDVQVSGAASVN